MLEYRFQSQLTELFFLKNQLFFCAAYVTASACFSSVVVASRLLILLLIKDADLDHLGLVFFWG